MATSGIDDGTGAGEAIVRVALDARGYALAQVALYKAVAGARLGAAKLGIVCGVAAVFLAGSALTALMVGLILALATLIGPLLATLAVVGVVLVIAGILGKLAATRIGAALGGDV